MTLRGFGKKGTGTICRNGPEAFHRREALVVAHMVPVPFFPPNRQPPVMT